MPPILASIIYLSFVVYLFWRDIRQKPNISTALWLPWSWVVISGSRFISQWLDMLGIHLGGGVVEEGSPIDAVYFFLAIVTGAQVLARRGVKLAEFIRHNRAVTFYLAFCLMAIVWSDFPLVGFKRWTKLIGSPIMVLIILTEPDPRESLIRLFKRISYVIIPISILFIKYYPEWGRGFDRWTGAGMNTGITTDKNTLGFDCFLLGFFYFWHGLNVWREPKSAQRRNELLFCAGFIVAIGWLAQTAHSSTPLVSWVIAMCITTFLGFKFVRKETISGYLIVTLVVAFIAEFVFNASALFIELIGKDSTLTGRTDIWKILLHWDVNPLIGTGFESFWLGDRREQLWAIYPELFLNSSHNGYLETYLNLGILGLLATLAMVLATYVKSLDAFSTDFQFARFRLSYLLAFLIYNFTEVAFRTHCVPFFAFFLVAIDYPWGSGKPLWGLSKSAPLPETDYEF